MNGSVCAVAASVGVETVGGSWQGRWGRWTLELATSLSDDPVILAEAPIGDGLPAYHERLRVRRRIIRQVASKNWSELRSDTGAGLADARVAQTSAAARNSPEPCSAPRPAIVFTDVARSRYVWTWDEARARPHENRYREFWIPGQEAYLRQFLSGTTSEPMVGAPWPGHARKNHCGLLRALMPEAQMGSSSARTVRQSIAWLQKRATLKEVVAVWKRMESLRIVDMRCGSGDWLMSAAGAVELLQLAMIDRLLTAVGEGEATIGNGAGWLIQEFDYHGGQLSIEELVRRRIIGRQTFGFDADRRQVRICRARLRRYGWGANSAGHTNVLALLAGTSRRRLTSRRNEMRAADQSASGYDPNEIETAEEELLVIVRTWLAAVDTRDEYRLVDDMRKLTFELERRSRTAIRTMDTAGCFDLSALKRLIERLAAETSGAFYVRERNGSTHVAGRMGRARRPRLSRTS